MIMAPGILALIAAAVLLAAYALYAAGAGVRILAGWNPASALPAQLLRERRTSLLSAILAALLGVELLCLTFFVELADQLHGFFTGAMCAAGTLNAGPYGLPTLLVMLVGSVLSVLWLIVNHLDARAPDFPLIRLKYLSLIPVAGVLAVQAFLLVGYFRQLNPTLITSCCATVFGENGRGIGADLAHLSPAWMQPLFWVTLAATLAVGLLSLRAGRPAALDTVYAGLSLAMLPVGLAAVVSFLSVRLYELPAHHCPFCLLQPEYGGVGYLLYAGLLLGSSLGMGVGLAGWLGRTDALREAASRLARQLKTWSLTGHALLAAVAGRPLLCSDFTL